MRRKLCNFFSVLVFGFKKYPDPPKEPLVPNTKFYTIDAPEDRPGMAELWTDYSRQLMH